MKGEEEMKKIGFSIMMVMLLLIMNITPLSAKTKVKVAFPYQDGLTEINDDGSYSGYTFDYLKELERFTNLQFEFVTYKGDVNEQIVAAMEDVQKGKVDLMGGMIYDESLTSMYDYTSTNYGMGNIALYVLSDNAAINDTNIYSLKKMDVGIISTKQKENVKLKEFGVMNGIEIIQHFYMSSEELLAALNNKEIDAIAESEQSGIVGNYRIVATFSPRPFYLVTTKGKIDLITELNEGMTKLNKEQPSFMSDLHETYFTLNSGDFVLTDSEKEFIKQHPTIDVALLGGKAPLQSKNGQGEIEGITIDLLNYISDLSGLKFEYHYTDSYDEYEKLFEDGKVVMGGGVTIPYYDQTKNLSFSRSYLDSDIEVVMTKGLDASKVVGKRLAIPKGTYYSGEYEGEIIYFDTPLDCFDAVDSGKADYSYLGSHTSLFYGSSYQFENITMFPQGNNYNIKNCFAVKGTASNELIDILNKGIDKAYTGEIQSIVFKNATYAKEDISFITYVKNNPLGATLFVVVLIGIFVSIRIYSNKKNNEKILKEYDRFQKISDLSGDCFIEYNVFKDTLKLSGGAAVLLSPEKKIEYYVNKEHNGNELFKQILNNQRTIEKESIMTFLDGTKRWQKIFLQPIFDDNNKMTHIIGKITDIQVQKEEQLLWKELARRDSLTNIYNAATCREMFNELLKQSKDNDMALIILDIDNFKSINDNYGHFYGDCVLQKLAETLQKITKPTDIIARVGGDEFIIGLKHPECKEEIADYCQQLMDELLHYQDHNITVSMGVAISRQNQTYDELYQKADIALYKVKNEGRNNFQFSNDFKKNN